MTVRRFPLLAFQEDVAAVMAGDVVHRFGKKALHDHKSAPVYVWVPGSGRGSKKIPTRGVDEHRTTSALDLSCDVYCKGLSFDQAWGLASNLSKAIRDVAQSDEIFDAVEWLEPGESYNQAGQTLKATITLMTSFDDVWVDVDTLEAPDPTNVIVTKIVGNVEHSHDVYSPGELALTVET
jgi:hypothetical protein